VNQKQTNDNLQQFPGISQSQLAAQWLTQTQVTPITVRQPALIDIKIKYAFTKLAYALPFRIAGKIRQVRFDRGERHFVLVSEGGNVLTFEAEGFPSDKDISLICLELG